MFKKLLEKIILYSVLFTIFVALGIAAFLFTFNTVWNIISSPTISTPNFVGLSLKDAVKIAGELDLILKIKNEVQDDTHPEGYIISQEPSPGAKIREESSIKIVIVTRSLGEKVPNLIGLSIYGAEEKLSEKNIPLSRKAYVYDDIVDVDTVISQYPPPGTTLGRESGVSLLISKGKKPIKMPLLCGLDVENAEYIIGLLGLSLVNIKRFDIEDKPDGEVIYQSISYGKEIKGGDEISLGIVQNGQFRSGKYNVVVSYKFLVPEGKSSFRVKIIKRDDSGDKVLVDKNMKGGSLFTGKTDVKGVAKLYISLDDVIYEIRRIN